MPTLKEIRTKFPQYDALNDQEFADQVYDKYYANKISRDEYNKRIGFTPPERPDLFTRFGGNLLEGAAGIPGLPVEVGALLGNVASSLTGGEWRNVESDPNIGQWGVRGWQGFFDRNVNPLPSISGTLPKPEGDMERLTDKAGQFIGSGAAFGPSAIVPTATAFVGSEAGRAADQLGLTKGYGEPIGALVGGLTPGAIEGQVTRGTEAASLSAIKKAKDAAYRASEDVGAIVNPNGMKRLYQNVTDVAAEHGFDPANEPGIVAVFKRLEDRLDTNSTLKDLDKIRKIAGNAAGNVTNKSQVALASKIKQTIDDFLNDIRPEEVLTGDFETAVKHLQNARGLNQKMRLAETIDEALYQAKNQAATSGVGGNLENAMRQKIKAILNSPKRRASFNKSEIKLMEGIARGTSGQNLLRWVGGFAPSKGFLPAALLAHLGFGSATGGLSSAATGAAIVGGAAASAAKSLAEKMTMGKINRLNATIRNRGGKPLTSAEKLAAARLEARRRANLLLKTGRSGALPAMIYQGPPQ